MTFSTNFLEFLKIISWPITIIFIIFSFKKTISNFINRIDYLKIFPYLSLETRERREAQENEAVIKQEDTNLLSSYNIDKQLVDAEIKAAKKKLHDKNQDRDELIQQIVIKDLIIQFERIYNLLLPPQIRLLKTLRDYYGKTIDDLAQQLILSIYYADPIYKIYDPAIDLSFLQNKQLINLEQNIYKITSRGIAFLQYIEKVKYCK